MDVTEFVSLGLATLAVGVILLVYMRRRRRAKAEPEKRIGQARRRRFIRRRFIRRRFIIEVAQEKRLGLPRRNHDCPPEGMGTIATAEVVPVAYLTPATQRDVSAIRDYRGVERRKRSRRTRDATSWRLTTANRRQTPGRRWGDRL